MTFENNNTVTQREHPAFEDDYIAPHRRPSDAGDRLAFAFVKALRFVADRFFAGRYGHRAVVLETVAAVPGMVGGLLQHLKALRYIRDDRGWIKELLDEAENERMHLMTFIEIAKPTVLERLLVLVVQGGFFNAFFLLYLASPKTAHRIVGYFEEEAVRSYTRPIWLKSMPVGTKTLPRRKGPSTIGAWRLTPGCAMWSALLAVSKPLCQLRLASHKMRVCVDILSRHAE